MLGFALLLGQRPDGGVEHVVQHAHLNGHSGGKALHVETGLAGERLPHKAGEYDRPQIAAAIRRQRLLAAGVGGRNLLGIPKVVVLIDIVQKQNARFGKVIGRAHDGIPQLARRQALVHPHTVFAGFPEVCARLNLRLARCGGVHQLPGRIVLDGLHKGAANSYRDIEIVPASLEALGSDELVHIGVIDAQHPHLCPTPRACGLHRGTGGIEHIDKRAGAGGQGVRAPHQCPARAQVGKIVAHATTPAHGLCRLREGGVNAGIALSIKAIGGIGHRLHKAVDQRGLGIEPGCGHDATRANGAARQIGGKLLLPVGLQLGRFHRCQGLGHAGKQLLL